MTKEELNRKELKNVQGGKDVYVRVLPSESEYGSLDKNNKYITESGWILEWNGYIWYKHQTGVERQAVLK